MKTNKSNLRDIILCMLMIVAAIFVVVHPVKKHAQTEKIHISNLVPTEFSGWNSKTYDTTRYTDKWNSINELLVRTYYKEEFGLLGPKIKSLELISEYTSDFRKNFSFHYPENCHRAGGNEVDFLKPLEVSLGNGKTITTNFLFIKGIKGATESNDKLVAYWMVVDNKQYYKTFFIKLNQMFSGLLGQAHRGFLIRVDYVEGLRYSEEGIQRAREIMGAFIKDFYDSLDEQKRELLFGK